jgi:hypothetical protein
MTQKNTRRHSADHTPLNRTINDERPPLRPQGQCRLTAHHPARHLRATRHRTADRRRRRASPAPTLEPRPEWVISNRPAHPALVSEADFVAVQGIRAPRPPEAGSQRTYLLAGLLRCGICGRRLDCHWVNDRPGYRCRHGRTTAHTNRSDRPRTLYLREDQLLADLAVLVPDDIPDDTSTAVWKAPPSEDHHHLRPTPSPTQPRADLTQDTDRPRSQ